MAGLDPGRDLIILSGGERSRSVYYADDWDHPVWANVRRRYRLTDRTVVIGDIYKYLPAKETVSGRTARVWEVVKGLTPPT